MLRAPVAALVIIVGALALADSARADPRFDPSFEVTLTQPAPQSPTGLTIRFGLESGLQFSTTVLYIPRDWGVANGEEIPIGTKLAAIESTETFGLINSACNTVIPIEFEMFNASLDGSQTVSFGDTESEQGLDPSTLGFGTQDFAEDRDANGLFDVIDRYPDFLNTRFGDVRPLTRLAGVLPIAGVPVLLQFLIFAPGTRLGAPDSELAQSIASVPESGYPMVMVVQDFRNPDNAHQPGPITDYCAPRDTSISFVTPDNGPPLLVNPQSGSYAFTLVTSSKRDADGDGYENSLDTCPLGVNIGGPSVQNDGDIDGDGMDAACDPNDDPLTGGSNYDEDGDGYLNRQDNCPLVLNDPSWTIDSSTQSDLDLDDLGDVCDPNPESPDGEAIVSVKSAGVVAGDAEGSGGPPKEAACPHCYRPGGSLSETDEGTGNTLAIAVGLIGVGAGATLIVVGGGTLYLLKRRRT